VAREAPNAACFGRGTTLAVHLRMLARLGPRSFVAAAGAALALMAVERTATAQDVPHAPAAILLTNAPRLDDSARQQHDGDALRGDRFFPGAGHVSLSASTGVPFLALGEVALGASDGFTVSAIGGVADPTPRVEYGVGGRIESSIFRAGRIGLVFTLPVLYYPPSAKRSGEAWVLTNPALLVQGALPWAGLHVYGGVGFLAASCTDGLLAHFDAGASGAGDARAPMVDGAWNTFHAGASIPTSASTALLLDGTLIMSGFTLSQTYAQTVGTPAVVEVGWAVRL
jgi:hypothetical protein